MYASLNWEGAGWKTTQASSHLFMPFSGAGGTNEIKDDYKFRKPLQIKGFF
jgi:hypothetical protein